MNILTFVAQKGGSGKSTLASSIAVAAKEYGEKVCIIDLDPQKSLFNWSKLRSSHNIDQDIPVKYTKPEKLKSILNEIKKQQFSLVVIDTPGGCLKLSSAAVKLADLNIIPVRPNIFDLWSGDMTKRTIEKLNKQFAFLLNQCPPAQQNSRIKKSSKILEDIGGLVTPLLSSRVAYQEAAKNGLGVTELSNSYAASMEISKLWLSIRRRMNKKSTNISNKRKAA